MMQLKQAIPAIWVYTTADAFNRVIGDGPAFLSREEGARLERIRQARLLYAGGESHRKYFLDEQRTQFDFPQVRAGNRVINLFVPLNVLKMISLKSADLLFGQEPLIRVDDDAAQAALSQFAERANLHSVLYAAAKDCSYEAEAFLEICRHRGEVYVRALDATEMFPVGALAPDGQYAAYVRRQVARISGTDQQPIYGLLETTYLAGSIERRLWQLEDNGVKRMELTLENWPTRPIGEDFAPLVKTGIDVPTIVWIPNELDHGRPVSDYDGLIELQDALNEANTRMKRVLHKHGSPKLRAPRNAADANGNFPADAEVVFSDAPDEYGYLTWDAQLDAAQKDRSFTLNAELITAETSPVLLGLKEGAAPDAYKKVRIEALNSVTKAGRKATNWKPGIRRVLDVVQKLASVTPGQLSYDARVASVEMRDGIPIDEEEQANVIATLRSAEAMSIEDSVERRVIDREAAAKEIARIKDEAAAKTPTIFAPLGGGPNEPNTPPVTQEAAA